jgi:hypothetical protein
MKKYNNWLDWFSIPWLWKKIHFYEDALTSESEEWARTHTHLENLCLKAGYTKAEIYAEEYDFTDIDEMADLLYKRIEELEAKLKEKTCEN